jgi:hypothetical protein
MTHHHHNTPGGPANTPHQTPERDGDTTGASLGRTAREGAHRQTGDNTAPNPAHEVSDPHPSNEEQPYREARPGGANPPKTNIGPNPARHTGKAPPRPHNSGSGPE